MEKISVNRGVISLRQNKFKKMHSLSEPFEFTHCFPAKVSNVLNLKLATWLLFLPCLVCWLPSKETMQKIQSLSPFDISWRTFLGFYCRTEQLLKGIIIRRDFPSVDLCATSQVFPQARPVITRSFSHRLLVKDMYEFTALTSRNAL